MSEVILICGCMASGKSELSEEYIKKDYIYLNRDTEGGKVASLIPKLENMLKIGSNIVLDNTFPTIEVRKPFIEACKKAGVPIRCIFMDTAIEDAQINALHRMWKRHKKFFFGKDDLKGVKDPNMFPAVALFRYRKELQKPTVSEGFDSVETITFKRRPSEYKNKALILDYDDTLRRSLGHNPFPVHWDEVELLPGRKEKIDEYVAAGYILAGVSNQSGVHKGILTKQMAIDCFQRTNDLLGHKIDFQFCPHGVPPTCYCRKPGSGLGVLLIEKYQLNPLECVFVGDQTSDKTWAKRLGFKYFHPDEFFK